ncbi:hypothetical protein Tco_1454780, partial [Tanacetum coccineum]
DHSIALCLEAIKAWEKVFSWRRTGSVRTQTVKELSRFKGNIFISNNTSLVQWLSDGLFLTGLGLLIGRAGGSPLGDISSILNLIDGLAFDTSKEDEWVWNIESSSRIKRPFISFLSQDKAYLVENLELVESSSVIQSVFRGRLTWDS